ncbi:uncharacterized protein [Diabrotica undecimpunctata]|uniref:uncharacterized protein isoform X2 n=1 Tax=Diabrotica undecimpunctata TaxID=50387 RepID=UPI003B638276
MERKEENEDTVTNLGFENRIFVNPEPIKKEPAPVYQDNYIEDYGYGGMTGTFQQNEDDLSGFQYFNSDVDIKLVEHAAKRSQSSEHDSFKNEIKEEPNRESAHDKFDDPDLNEYSLKIEIEEDEIKLMPYEEKQTNEKDFPQEKDTWEIMKTIDIHSSNKEQHVSHPAEEKSLKCEICGKQFRRKKNFNRHMKTHTGEKPYMCEICFKRFSRIDNIKQHMTIHTGEKTYKCEICFKPFNAANNLKYHIRTHTGEKSYKCEICFKQFIEAGSLKRHLRVHTGEKPYKCGICFKPFSAAGSLKIHLRLHTGEKPYKCEICFEQFSDAGKLKRHFRIHTRKAAKVF